MRASLLDLSLASLADRVREGSISALDVVEAYAARIAEVEPNLHAFLHLDLEDARRQAERIDVCVRAGADPGPLSGAPIAIKDNISTLGMPTTCASRILEGFVPVYDATAVAKLRNAGAVVIGKTNLDAFAMGSSTENSAFGPTRNPWDPARVPGGSSGGSAVAVAAGEAVAALGSDTGGSVRQPGSYCGLVALKPQYGSVSRYGLVAYASSLDQIGPMARTAEDAARLFDVIRGADPFDATSRPDGEPATPRLSADEGLRDRVLGVPRAWLETGLDPEVADRFAETEQRFASLGARILDVDLPPTDAILATYYVLADAEASSNLARYDGVRYGLRDGDARTLHAMYERTRGRGFGLEVKRRILLGTFVLSSGYYDAYYGQAQRARAALRRAYVRALGTCDAVLVPTAPTPAFRLGEKVDDPLAMYLSDIFTLPSNLVGAPAIAFPAGTSAAGLPIGMQLLGREGDEATLLTLAHRFASAHDGAGSTLDPASPLRSPARIRGDAPAAGDPAR